jgi:GMP synthase PP-ATPase subunit
MDGIGAISLADGVVRFDLMSITSIQDGKAVAARSGGLAMSLPTMIRVHDQLGQMITELVQKGVLQKNELPAKAAQLSTTAQASETAL